MAVSPDGRHIVSSSRDGTVAVWDLTTGQRLHVLAGPEAGWPRLNCVAVSPDGQLIVAGNGSGAVAVWDLATGRRLHVLDTGQRS